MIPEQDKDRELKRVLEDIIKLQEVLSSLYERLASVEREMNEQELRKSNA